MDPSPSISKLATITDQGHFERLATAVLREADSVCESLTHTGVNAEGKTIKSPLDGICFEEGATPAHLIAVHHTICVRSDLEKKWLHDPSKVKARGIKPTAPPGDFIKTAEIVNEERKLNPSLLATLILTTNQDPSESLIRAINREGLKHKINIRIWSRSRIAHTLDTTPGGQWIRKKYLGIEQELLSQRLLIELSNLSLKINHPPDNREAWVPRELDEKIQSRLIDEINFLVAESGMGKSVCCYKLLASHIESGGAGLVISHETISNSSTIQQAIETALRTLCPSLATGFDQSVFAGMPPLLLIVEDINKSGQSQTLFEKIAAWCSRSDEQTEHSDVFWRLICPIWPQVLMATNEMIRKRIEPFLIVGDPFSAIESNEAVRKRACLRGDVITDLIAEEISTALGHDPLLIALHDQPSPPQPNLVFTNFVERVLNQTSNIHKDNTPADYLDALKNVAAGMLRERRLQPTWKDVCRWTTNGQERSRILLSHLAHDGQIIRFSGSASAQSIEFRHDRVRDWLLSKTIVELAHDVSIAVDLLREPYYAEIIGNSLLDGSVDFVDQVFEHNVLALFYAARLFGEPESDMQKKILFLIEKWLDEPATHDDSNVHLRWDALSILAQTESSSVIALVSKFPEQNWSSMIARMRNGDIGGAIDLCMYVEPGHEAVWRDKQIEHLKARFEKNATTALESVLLKSSIAEDYRVGSLRLAGFLADTSLLTAIEHCWNNDATRNSHLKDYLWAFAMCCGANAEKYLKPVFDAWSALPVNGEEKWLTPRFYEFAHEVHWAFQKWVPTNAIDYFIERSQDEDLHEPITHLLCGLDDVRAIEFSLKKQAKERLKYGFSSSDSYDTWRRAQEKGRAMSDVSRSYVQKLWQSNHVDKTERIEALSLWASNVFDKDINILNCSSHDPLLKTQILRHRLRRGDKQSIPDVVEMLGGSNWIGWLWEAKRVWCDQLTPSLDRLLSVRCRDADSAWCGTSDEDLILAEVLMLTETSAAEALLLEYWDSCIFAFNLAGSRHEFGRLAHSIWPGRAFNLAA